jgi:regulator of sigma E protease
MAKPKGQFNKYFKLFLLAVILATVIRLIAGNIGVFGNVLLVMLGFGVVVLVHEFGHFVVAKLCGIKVEAFSIGFPPVAFGILRTEKGLRIRVLPDFFKNKDAPAESLLSFTVGKKAKPGETEYRIGLVPFGGFVKMLGQEDIGSSQAGDDPRSFANKSIAARMAVISAGVVFNAVSAVIIFMAAFLSGINLPPAVVGGVMPGSPAQAAGLKAGDEIIEINGKSENLDFSNIAIAAAFSDVNKPVPMKVRRPDNSMENFAIAAEKIDGQRMRVFGIIQPQSLTIDRVSDANMLLEKTGLRAGDRIKAVDGQDVQTYWQMEEIISDTFFPTAAVLAERNDGAGQKTELVESKIPLDMSFANRQVDSEADLAQICSMVPRLRITAVEQRRPSLKDRLLARTSARTGLQRDDIILAVDDVENPTYKEIRDITTEYKGKELAVKVLRTDAEGLEKTVTVTVVPRRTRNSELVLIGIAVALDAERPVVAKTIAAKDGPEKLQIPRGAAITAVDGTGVSNFFDIIREIKKNEGQVITIDYRLNPQVAGAVSLDLRQGKNLITVKSEFAEFVPFKPLERLYKAKGPVDAVVLGYKKTIMFIVQTYATLKSLVQGLVSLKDLMGPVGIIKVSYDIVAEQPFIYYVYFLGLISACIAVFNFLPLPPLDGGLVVVMLAEKIKGSALSSRAQGIIAYAGWVLIGSLILYVTFNDIVRSFFS